MEKYSEETTKILDVIKKYGSIRSSEIKRILEISDKTTHKHLKRLLDDDLIMKSGTTPQVYYSIKLHPVDTNIELLSEYDFFVEYNYIYVAPDGQIIRGLNGFNFWCQKNKFNLEKEKVKFSYRIKDIQNLKKHGLLSAKKIILSGKKTLYLDDIFFSDFYNIDYFGKTKLGQLTYLGKLSQNKSLIREVSNYIKPSILYLIDKYEIKHICFIPPTIERRIQFLDVLKSNLNLNIPELKANKLPSLTKVPQKTLKKLEDRIFNAQTTIIVSPIQEIIGNVLIIDDATGSGATLNETALKIKKISKNDIKVYGYSVVGSYKGFDIINEV